MRELAPEAALAVPGIRLRRDPDSLVGSVHPSVLPASPESRRRGSVPPEVQAGDLGSEALLHRLVEMEAARRPDAIGPIHRDRHLSFRQLDDRASRLARRLSTLGVEPEARVALFLDPCLELAIALLGVLKAGGAWVPLDPTHPRERLRLILNDCRATHLITRRALLEALPEDRPPLILIDAGRPASGDRESLPERARPENLAYVIYTSGSTGRPKGVQISHRSAAGFLASMRLEPGIRERDLLLAVTTFSFDISILELLLPLAAGARVELVDRNVAADGLELRDRLRRGDVTMMQATPATWRMLIEAGWRGGRGFTALVGGEALPQTVASVLSERCTSVWNLYGPTETTVWATCCRIRTGDRISIGRPIANTRVHVLDPRRRRLRAAGRGALYIGGAGLARGYCDRPALTAERFVPDAWCGEPGARLYDSGDIARWLPDGALDCLGRADRQVKIRGFRVELGEIEALIRSHPGVGDCAVALRRDPRGEARLAAYLTRHPTLARPLRRKSDWQSDQVAQWEQVWDDAYREPRGGKDPTFGIVGWESSYTGLPIPPAEMRQWIDGTVDRISALAPFRILEIGCGTGLLLRRLARGCTAYFGTDISRRALDLLDRQLRRDRSLRRRVKLAQRAADDFTDFGNDAFDTVILNSVVQYFPGLEYLETVIERALEHLAPGGSIFLGDLRRLALLEALRAAVELHQAPADLPLDKVSQRVCRRLQQEEELLLEPAFFASLAQRLPQIATVRVELKRGPALNEFTRFRYDVTLTKSGLPRAASTPREVLGSDRRLVGRLAALDDQGNRYEAENG